jgi:hypothetical protein
MAIIFSALLHAIARPSPRLSRVLFRYFEIDAVFFARRGEAN